MPHVMQGIGIRARTSTDLTPILIRHHFASSMAPVRGGYSGLGHCALHCAPIQLRLLAQTRIWLRAPGYGFIWADDSRPAPGGFSRRNTG